MAKVTQGIQPDPRLQEKYMQEAEFEKMKADLLNAESAFKKIKEDVYNFPKVVHPMAAHCRQMQKSFEVLYPKETPFYEVGKEFIDSFDGVASAYNEMVSIT